MAVPSLPNTDHALKVAMQAHELRKLNRAVQRLAARNHVLRTAQEQTRSKLAMHIALIEDCQTPKSLERAIRRAIFSFRAILAASDQFLIDKARRDLQDETTESEDAGTDAPDLLASIKVPKRATHDHGLMVGKEDSPSTPNKPPE